MRLFWPAQSSYSLSRHFPNRAPIALISMSASILILDFTVSYSIINWVLSKRRWTVSLSNSINGCREALPLDSSQ